MSSFFSSFIDLFIRWLPILCLLCGNRAIGTLSLCDDCLRNLPILAHQCRLCAQFLPCESVDVCGSCLKQPPPFTVTHTLFPYEFPIIQLITQLKFNGALCNAQLLGELLAEKIQSHWYRLSPLPDVIIPVPLHPIRLKERGFNQALEIAKPIAKRLNLPIDWRGCQRVKHTTMQSSLKARERAKNMVKAFHVSKDYSNQHIAVIDDVMTTGQTMTALCKQLKAAGAVRIDVWCCARRGSLHAH